MNSKNWQFEMKPMKDRNLSLLSVDSINSTIWGYLMLDGDDVAYHLHKNRIHVYSTDLISDQPMLLNV